MIRSIVFVTVGINFLSTVTDVTRHVDFNQFGEPFRRALLRDVVPTWSEMCQQIMEVVNTRGSNSEVPPRLHQSFSPAGP